MQGVVGTMPWVAMGFMTLYLQLLGFTDMNAAMLVALFSLGGALGSFSGGYIGAPGSLSHGHHWARLLLKELASRLQLVCLTKLAMIVLEAQVLPPGSLSKGLKGCIMPMVLEVEHFCNGCPDVYVILSICSCSVACSSEKDTCHANPQHARLLSHTATLCELSQRCPAGDMLARCFPNSGRIIAAQFSVLCTFPCTLLIFRLLPTSAAAGMNTLVLPYGFSFFFTGLLISW